MDFEEAHEAWIAGHLGRRRGERRGRLERGHAHAEIAFARNVWWPLFEHFDFLHPEYEVPDWRGRPYFADFAWIAGQLRILIEIKGFTSHVRDMDRRRYGNELNRETFLTGMGFLVLSFAYDDVEHHPDICMALLRMVFSRFQPAQGPVSRAVFAEKEIVRLAIRSAAPIRPKDVVEHFAIDAKTAISMLNKLCEKGWLKCSPRGSGDRRVRYELAKGVLDYLD